MQTVDFKTVVIGSGLAGLTAAFYSSNDGSVAMITKSRLDTSNSYFAQVELQQQLPMTIQLNCTYLIQSRQGAGFVMKMLSGFLLMKEGKGF